MADAARPPVSYTKPRCVFAHRSALPRGGCFFQGIRGADVPCECAPDYTTGMETIVDYIEREQRTFDECPFCPPDSLVFSILSYLNFEAYPRGGMAPQDNVLLHDVLSLTPLGGLANDNWLEDAGETTASFLLAMRASRRFRSIRVGYYAHETSESIEKQFCAATFFLPDGSAYVSYRGTDGTLAGWKEDFNLCFKEVIPSQRTAVAYLSGIASTFEGPIRVGGHSKGGNLAEYAALTCDDSTYKRIVAVFNHDGPAFLDDPSPRIDEPAFAKLLHKTVPDSSLFGMLLEERQDFHIVKSNALPVLSHSPFSWLIEGSDFDYEPELERGMVVFDKTLNDWLRSVDAKGRERFIDTIYDLLTSTNASTWAEFQESLIANVRTVLSKGMDLDPETKDFIVRTFASAFGILRKETVSALRARVRAD